MWTDELFDEIQKGDKVGNLEPVCQRDQTYQNPQ